MLSKQILRPDLNRLFKKKKKRHISLQAPSQHYTGCTLQLGYITLVVSVCDPVAAILVFSSSVTETCPLQG